MWFLGLAGLYAVYMLSTFVRMGGGFSLFHKLVMVLGPTSVALAVLVAPSVFAASLDRFDPLGDGAAGSRTRPWAILVTFALAAYLLSTVGPAVALPLGPVVQDTPPPSAPTTLESELQAARFLIPVGIAALALLSGIAGALVGHATRHWRPGRRNATRWLACLAMMASFLIPLLGAVSAIVHHGASPIWVLVGPLALPLILIGTLAWRERSALGVPVPWSIGNPRRIDADSLDRIVSGVVAETESGVEGVARTEAEIEMTRLAAGIRRVAGPRAVMSESRAAEIVTTMLEASPPTSGCSPPRWRRIRPGSVGGFCTSWTCIAAGLAIVSPLGGVPVSVVSAVFVGLLGATGIVMICRRWPELSPTVTV